MADGVQPLSVLFFDDATAFREWLAANHAEAPEVWVGFMRKGVDGPKLTYKEAVDEALCFGWIDGIRKKIDDRSYTNRFTPRRPRSNWSNVNIARVGELTAEGRMHAAGLAAFEARTPERSGVYSFEQRESGFAPEFEEAFRANAAAWANYEAQPAHYRRITAHWVMSAKRDETRERRLQQLMSDSAAGQWISMLRR